MRISDWSSDVCSSDLHGPVSPSPPGRKELMADDFERQLLRRMADDERGTWREALRADFAPWFDDLHFGLACGDGWRAILRDLTTAIAQIVGGPRSEEHTSELQSLMRISYAVFCLKKKK